MKEGPSGVDVVFLQQVLPDVARNPCTDLTWRNTPWIFGGGWSMGPWPQPDMLHIWTERRG